MEFRALGLTGLQIAPIVFGGNVFGWTIDEKTSFDLLDQFVDLGFNAIDTADVYSVWADGNQGGESETIIGRWLKANPGKRDKVLIFTKVGGDMRKAGHKGLSARWIAEAVEDSLRRLQVEQIDLYQSHWPDAETPHEETLGAYQKLLEAGKIRAIGASNFDANLLSAALEVSRAQGLPAYQTLQPEYNLYDRAGYESGPRELAIREGMGVIPYYSLASGFLTGKYRKPEDLKDRKRGEAVGKYLNDHGFRIIDALDTVALAHDAKPAEVALAWLMAQDGVTAPIASATSKSQLASFAKAVELKLSVADTDLLTGVE